MATRTVERHRTAIGRSELSKPVRLAMEDGLLNTSRSLFDFGCGRGDDVRHLRALGVTASGWDPVHSPKAEQHTADIVNLGYVVNVIEKPAERVSCLREAWSLAAKVLVVAARLTFEEGNGKAAAYRDGWLTSRGTFQKYFDQRELREWIDDALGEQSVPAAPGIFYVFRDHDLRESFIASRYRRRFVAPRLRQSDVLYEKHRELFQPLIEFITNRGRLPDATEVSEAYEICDAVGSLQRAFGIIRRVTGIEDWDRIREERAQDLLTYLALVRFEGRPKYSELPSDLQLDVKAFFSSYSRACKEADALLFSAGNTEAVNRACNESPVGKKTHEAIYVHKSALSELPPVLRIYEGCARAYIGNVPEANIVKLHRLKKQVSYLSYPDFDTNPHPGCAGSLVVPLQSFDVRYRNYAASENPFILHRKEEFVSSEYPLRDRFAKLTRQEERAGLFEEARTIGTRAGWESALEMRSLRLVGHQLRKGRKPTRDANSQRQA